MSAAELPPLPPGWRYEYDAARGYRTRMCGGRATFWCASTQDAAASAALLALQALPTRPRPPARQARIRRHQDGTEEYVH